MSRMDGMAVRNLPTVVTLKRDDVFPLSLTVTGGRYSRWYAQFPVYDGSLKRIGVIRIPESGYLTVTGTSGAVPCRASTSSSASDKGHCQTSVSYTHLRAHETVL